MHAHVLRATAVAFVLTAAGEARAFEEIALDRVLSPIGSMAAALSAAWPHGDFVVGELGGKVVKGAPYSAEAVSESVQTLADGNRIVRRHVSRLARDGEGRTRQERVVDGRTDRVFINDVVAHRSWALVPDAKRASELPAGLARRDGVPQAPLPGNSAEEMRTWAEAMREWAREFGARLRAEPMSGEGLTPSEQRTSRVTAALDGDGRTMREVEVHVVHVAESPSVAAGARVPPVSALHGMPPLPMMLTPPGAGVTTSLGSREFDGVRADGTRTTWTIAAGRIGNDKPIEIVSERWYAPDLMLVVATRRSDPRSGESSYRLTNLKRGEPDAALFRVPADYEVRAREGRSDKRERK